MTVSLDCVYFDFITVQSHYNISYYKAVMWWLQNYLTREFYKYIVIPL